jgi:hypothetical protein
MSITPTTTMVGPTGGMASSSDGQLEVTIPAGALPANVAITVQAASAPATGALGTVFDIGPTGTQFATPVTMTFHYDSTDLASHAAAELRAATYANGGWQILPGFKEDTTAMTVSGLTTHLSPYGVVVAATGSVCAPVAAHAACAADGGVTSAGIPNSGGGGGGSTGAGGGTTGAGGGSFGTGGGSSGASSGGATSGGSNGATIDAGVGSAPNGSVGPGSGGASGAPGCGSPETCATATAACAQYPGASLANCTDDTSGYSGQCCFPPSAPLCFAVSLGSTCQGGANGGNAAALDASAGSSPPSNPTPNPAPSCTVPTCATANPCAQYPGAKTQNCVESSTGVTASCCYDPGAPVCFTESGAHACSGSPNGTTCSAAPTCATANPCSGYTGATVQSCTDSANGYQATCCLPVGVLPSTAAPTNSGSAGGMHSGGAAADASVGIDPGSGGGTSGGPNGGTSGGPGGGTSGGPNGGTTGGPSGTGGSSDAASAPSCMFSSTASPDNSTPCTLTEMCSDGHSYEVSCDFVTNACTCAMDGKPVAATTTAACQGLSPQALVGCGFPVSGAFGGGGPGGGGPVDGGTGGGPIFDDAGGGGPPPFGDASSGGSPPPQPCQLKPLTIPMGPGSPCAVQESCPDGHVYAISCDGADGGGGASCTCTTDGVQTGTAVASCMAFSPQVFAACGYPPGQ